MNPDLEINHRERRERREKPEPLSLTPCFSAVWNAGPEPLSLTPCFSWVLAGPGMPSTVSTVSLRASLSQRDYVTQPRVATKELFGKRTIVHVVLFSPCVPSIQTPSTLKGLRLSRDTAPSREFLHSLPLFHFGSLSLATTFLGQCAPVDFCECIGGPLSDQRVRVDQQILQNASGRFRIGSHHPDLDRH